MKRKGFTLVEMLVVVVVIVTLMTIVFRLSSVGSNAEARSVTAERLHRLENALSGYYAAFGTYPPVALHGSRNPELGVTDYGYQDEGNASKLTWNWINGDGTRVTNGGAENDAWQQVSAACRSQPIDCQYPFPASARDYVKTMSDLMEKSAENMSEGRPKRVFSKRFDTGFVDKPGRFNGAEEKVEWADIQLFKFGLMSYLLPRYLVMMNADAGNDATKRLFTDFHQWTKNNTVPRNPLNGNAYNGWYEVYNNISVDGNGGYNNKVEAAGVANIPSQAVCARWIANFEKSLACHIGHKLFGVELMGGRITDWLGCSGIDVNDVHIPPSESNKNKDSSDDQYLLDKITIKDGWGNEFYYYSPAPYQSYVVWSAGPNGKTYPPWIAWQEDSDSNKKRCIGYWVRDDMVNLSH